MKKEQNKNFSYLVDVEDRILCSQVLDQFYKYQRTGCSSCTPFLDQRKCELVENVLKKVKAVYRIEQPHPLCEKVVLSFGEQKAIAIVRIESKEPLTHPSILGSLFALGLEVTRFGDIFVEKDVSYLTCLSSLVPFLKEQWTSIGKQKIYLEECNDLLLTENHFEEFSIIVSSLRLDQIVAKLSHQSRSKTLSYLKSGMVLKNYQLVQEPSLFLRERDILSLRGIGKFQIGTIQKQTKNENKILEIKRYQ